MARPAPAPRSAYRWFTALQTRWLDNDRFGHMNNAVHYQLFDTAIALLHEEWAVYGGAQPLRDVVVESGCRYLAEARFPDTIHAGLRVAHMGRSSWRYDIGLFRNDEDSAFAEGFFAQVQTGADGLPQPLPEGFRARLAGLAA